MLPSHLNRFLRSMKIINNMDPNYLKLTYKYRPLDLKIHLCRVHSSELQKVPVMQIILSCRTQILQLPWPYSSVVGHKQLQLKSLYKVLTWQVHKKIDGSHLFHADGELASCELHQKGILTNREQFPVPNYFRHIENLIHLIYKNNHCLTTILNISKV